MNFYKFLERQKLERYQAFIVHYPPFSGKTRFAQRLCLDNPSLFYVDLLTSYLASQGLPKITDFGLKPFQKWLLDLACPSDTQTLILDHVDFLVNTWKAEEKEQFISWLRRTLRTPIDTEKTFVFFIQDDGIISTAQLINSYGESRILKLSEFDAL